MIEATISAALEESVADVLEKMFFVRWEPSESNQGTAERETCANVSFRGSPSGVLALRVTQKEARSIAADFLGASEEELSERQIEEVICELANMICGSVLSRIESTTTFQLAEPSIVTPEPSPSATKDALCHVVALAGGSLTVVLKTEP
jgi:CheY-specific phosphatase CheX